MLTKITPYNYLNTNSSNKIAKYYVWSIRDTQQAQEAILIHKSIFRDLHPIISGIKDNLH